MLVTSYTPAKNEFLTVSTSDGTNEAVVKGDFSLCFSQSLNESGDSAAVVQIESTMAIIDQQVVVTTLRS